MSLKRYVFHIRLRSVSNLKYEPKRPEVYPMIENSKVPLQRRNRKLYLKDQELNPKVNPESDLSLGDFMIFVPNGSGNDSPALGSLTAERSS